jgi:hypothetical protein
MFGLKMSELVVVVVVLADLLFPALFLQTRAKTLRLTRVHQTASPGFVWLMLIPVFNLGWQCYLLRAATKGIKGKLDELGRDSGDAGFGVGLTYQVLSCLAVVTSLGRQHGNDQTSKLAGARNLDHLLGKERAVQSRDEHALIHSKPNACSLRSERLGCPASRFRSLPQGTTSATARECRAGP